jgi:zinc transporter ZupT
MIILISIATLVSTFLGGMFALRFKDKLHLILGFSAGAVIGVAFFDLLPEAIELGSKNYSVSYITSITALGFIIYTILDRFIFFNSHDEEHKHSEEIGERVNKRGVLGAGSLSVHSFLDGAAIGLAFQVSAAVGAIVAVAVLVHDFSDGINTINLVLKNSGTRTQAFKWLLADAIAPVLGVISTLFFSVPESTLGIILAVFSGFFLYIGASDLLPESHHNHPTAWTTIATVLGIAVLYAAIHLAGV